MIPSRWLAAVVVVTSGATMARTQNELHAAIDQALDKARPALLAHLRKANEQDVRAGETALLALAAIHDGVDAGKEPLATAIVRLAKAECPETYDLALRLVVAEALPTFPDRGEVAKRDSRRLLTHRSSGGGFSYGREPMPWDLSNTQYAALGLRAAKVLGVDVPRTVWASLADRVGDQQGSYGGFGYGAAGGGGDTGYASMTAAGIAVLAICRQNLDGEKTLAGLDSRITRGWRWFDRNPKVVGSAQERWSFYFHYGLERAAILTDVEKVGGVDWYATGARMLIGLQERGGGWRSMTDGYPGAQLDAGRGDSVPTAFAILFLRRKFQKLGAVTPHVVPLAGLGPASPDHQVEACTAELVRRGKTALLEVVQALRTDVAPRRRAAAAALKAIAGDTFGFDPARDEAANSDALRRIELWYLRNR